MHAGYELTYEYYTGFGPRPDRLLQASSARSASTCS